MTYFPDTASGTTIANLPSANTLASTDVGVVSQGGNDGKFTLAQLDAWRLTQGGFFTKVAGVIPTALAYAATVTIDATQGNDFIVGASASGSGAATTFTVTGLTGNITLANPTGLVEGQLVNIWLPQDAAGGRTITYGTLFLPMDGASAYVLSTAANAIDLLACKYIMGQLRYTGRKVS